MACWYRGADHRNEPAIGGLLDDEAAAAEVPVAFASLLLLICVPLKGEDWAPGRMVTERKSEARVIEQKKGAQVMGRPCYKRKMCLVTKLSRLGGGSMILKR